MSIIDRYKKKREAYSDLQALQKEYEIEMRKNIAATNNDVVKFLEDYFAAKIELNRTLLETLDPDRRNDKRVIKNILLQNKMMFEFIDDVLRIRTEIDIEAANRVPDMSP